MTERRVGRAGDWGGVGLEQCFLATGSGDLRGGECVAACGLFRLNVLQISKISMIIKAKNSFNKYQRKY